MTIATSGASEEFSSEGFDLDALPKSTDGNDNNGDGEDVVLEIGGGTSTTTATTKEKTTSSPSDESSSASSPNNKKKVLLSPEIEKAEDYKSIGNTYFKSGDYPEAIESYTDAIDAVPTDSSTGEKTGQELIVLRDEYDENQRELMLKKRREEDEKRYKSGHAPSKGGTGGGARVPPSAATRNGDVPVQPLSKQTSQQRQDKDDDENDDEKEQEQPSSQPFQPPKHRYSTYLAVYYCNRAACALHLTQSDDAIRDATIATLYNPTYTKAYIRRMMAYEQIDEIEKALDDAQTAQKLDPTNKQIRQHVSRLDKLNKERMEKLKEETMGKLKDLGNSILGNFGLSLDNFKAEQDPGTGSYNISFNQGGGGK